MMKKLDENEQAGVYLFFLVCVALIVVSILMVVASPEPIIIDR